MAANAHRLLVLRDVMFGDRRHFRQLQSQSEEGIASNILAERLRTLVEAGLLTRDDARRGQRATYSLTEPAIQLVPVLVHLGSWGLRHRPTSPELRVRAELLEAGGLELWEEFMAELRERHLGVPRPVTNGPTADPFWRISPCQECSSGTFLGHPGPSPVGPEAERGG